MDLEKLKELLKKHGLNDDDIDDIVRESSKPADGEGEGGEPTPNPEGEGQPKPDGEPNGEPAPEGEGDGKPAEGNPEPNEPEGGEPEGEPQPQPEGGEPQPNEPDQPASEGEGQPAPEGESNPEPVAQPVTREEYDELKKALEGLGARFDALEGSLAESGVIREAKTQVGIKTPEANDNRHDDEGWDDLLGAMNGR